MARATRIYLVVNKHYECNCLPIAAFTVKYEAVEFIDEHPNKNQLKLYGGPDGYVRDLWTVEWDEYNHDGTMIKD